MALGAVADFGARSSQVGRNVTRIQRTTLHDLCNAIYNLLGFVFFIYYYYSIYLLLKYFFFN